MQTGTLPFASAANISRSHDPPAEQHSASCNHIHNLTVTLRPLPKRHDALERPRHQLLAVFRLRRRRQLLRHARLRDRTSSVSRRSASKWRWRCVMPGGLCCANICGHGDCYTCEWPRQACLAQQCLAVCLTQAAFASHTVMHLAALQQVPRGAQRQRLPAAPALAPGRHGCGRSMTRDSCCTQADCCCLSACSGEVCDVLKCRWATRQSSSMR